MDKQLKRKVGVGALLLFLGIGITALHSSGQILSPLLSVPYDYAKDPSLSSNLKILYRSSSLALSDLSAVATWPDLSGNGNDATQSTGGNQPTYHKSGWRGYPSVRFYRPNSTFLSIPPVSVNFQNASIYVVCQQGGADVLSCPGMNCELSNSTEGLWSMGTDLVQYAAGFQNFLYSMSFGGVKGGNPQIPYSMTILAERLNASNVLVNIGGMASSASALTAHTATWSSIGRTEYGSTYGNWDVLEVAYFNTALSTAQHAKVMGSLQARYGLSPQTPMKMISVRGDSMTYGDTLTSPMSQVHEMQLAAILGPNYTVYGYGVSGAQQASAMSWLALYNASNAKNIYVLLAGTDDLYFGQTTAQLDTSLQTLCTAAHTAGAKMVINTILPRSGAGTPGNFETLRQTENTTIRTNTGICVYDAVSDIGNDPNIGQAGDQNNPVYYNTDTVHPTAAGAAIIAAYELAAILPL